MTYKEYVENRNKLMQEAKNLMNEGKIEEFKAKKEEVEALDKKWEETAEARANLEALENAGPKVGMQIIDVAGNAQTGQEKKEDIFDTAEYRDSFMEYICRGTKIPEKYRNEAQKTTAADGSTVIPTTIVREIIKELKSYGNIYAKVRKLNVQGGVEFPILTLKPTATWIGEGASESKKIKADEKVSFSYYGLECKIAQSLLASIVTFEEFQSEFVSLATEAIIIALENAVINGTGTGQPLGILKDTRIKSTNVIQMTEKELGDWKAWKKKVFAKMKKAYRNGEFFMAQSSFDGYIDAMTDANGQPIGRVNYGIDGGETYRFGGKTVETVEEDILPDFGAAEVGDVVAVFTKLSDYAINSNMQMTSVKWIDHDTNEVKNKVIVIADGKLLDPNGTLIIKKKASTTTPSQNPENQPE
ncbi:phage major capsid protein [Senimuribacter intestinalis]|uniref:phage major capsid protein n=1 Tax=Senimuribacter intestinalis TaxID=2941507 RepID=UPI0020404701|nr:phage major capsid protein [Senimuribacter intestinalis]